MWNVEISFGANNYSTEKITIGTFSAESYGEIPETVSDLLEDSLSRISIKNSEIINISVDLRFTKTQDEDGD